MNNNTLADAFPLNSTTNCSTTTPQPPPQNRIRSLTYEEIINISLNTFIFVGGLIGNVFVVTVILRRKKMHTITNWFVLNLAISSIAIVCLTIPTANIANFVDWPWGDVGCKYLVAPVMEHLAGVCVLTHTALSLARYITVKHSLKGLKLKGSHVFFSACMIWLIAFITMSATLMGPLGDFKLGTNALGLLSCQLWWKSNKERLIYRGLIFLLTYVVPMVATGFAYWRIHLAVSASLKHLYQHMSGDGLKNRKMKTRRMNRVLMTMYVLFGVSTLPLQLLYVVNDIMKLRYSYGIQILWLICVALFYFQVVFHPFVLFYMGEDYRKELYRLPVCRCVAAQTRLRRFSSVFSSSIRGSNPNKRASTTSVITRNERSRMMDNDRKMSMPLWMRHKASNASTLNNEILQTAEPMSIPYGGFDYNFPNRDDILQTAEHMPFLDLNADENEDADSIGYIETDTKSSSDNTLPNVKFENGLTDDINHLYCTNSSNLSDEEREPDGYASSFLYNSDSHKSLNGFEEEKGLPDKLNKLDTRTEDDTIKSIIENFNNDIGQESVGLSPEPQEESSFLQKKTSSDSLTAYYDDGSIHYIYDVNFGRICFEQDDGKETVI